MIDLELRRGATLSGRISGVEINDLAKVVIVADGGAASVSNAPGIVDHEGRYSIPNLGPGQWHVAAWLQDSGRQVSGQLKVEKGVSEVELDLDLELKTSHTVAGVVSWGGEPKRGIQVYASGMEPRLGHAQAMTGSDGRFRLNHLPAGKYRLRVGGGASSYSQGIEIPTEEDIVIDLRATRISGFVRDELGERPMAGAALRLERVGADPSGFFSAMVEPDSRGYFILNAGPGLWRLVATKAGYGPAEITVDMGAGGPYENLELRLSPTDGISFDVIAESGTLPSQVLTAVLDRSERPISQGYVPAGEAGTVRLSMVPAGTWELLVQAGESAIVRTTITAPGHVGQVRLPRGAMLRIKVPTLAGERFAQVRLAGPDGRPHFMLKNIYTAAHQWPMWYGEATISWLSPGGWKFTIDHSDGRSWSGQAMVVAGETSAVVVP